MHLADQSFNYFNHKVNSEGSYTVALSATFKRKQYYKALKMNYKNNNITSYHS